MRACIFLLFLAFQGCSESASKPPVTSQPTTLDFSRGDNAAILQTLSRSHEKATSLFGPHQLKISTETKLSKDKEQLVFLQENFSLWSDPAGQAFSQSTNNQNDGVEAYQTSTQTALALRFGPLQEAPREVVSRARDAAYTSTFANLEPLSPWISFVPNGERDILGKKGLVFTLQQKDGSAPNIASLLPEKAWRATIAPEAISGELVLEASSGFLLGADFALQYNAVRDDQKILFDVKVKAELTASGDKVAPIQMPELDELAPRLRMEKERLDLIGKAALDQQKEKKKKAPRPAWTRPASQPAKAPSPTSAPK